MYIGHLILKKLSTKQENKISMFDVYKELNKNGVSSYRQLLFSILFLYSCGLIEFNHPYIEGKLND